MFAGFCWILGIFPFSTPLEKMTATPLKRAACNSSYRGAALVPIPSILECWWALVEINANAGLSAIVLSFTEERFRALFPSLHLLNYFSVILYYAFWVVRCVCVCVYECVCLWVGMHECISVHVCACLSMWYRCLICIKHSTHVLNPVTSKWF